MSENIEQLQEQLKIARKKSKESGKSNSQEVESKTKILVGLEELLKETTKGFQTIDSDSDEEKSALIDQVKNLKRTINRVKIELSSIKREENDHKVEIKNIQRKIEDAKLEAIIDEATKDLKEELFQTTSLEAALNVLEGFFTEAFNDRKFDFVFESSSSYFNDSFLDSPMVYQNVQTVLKKYLDEEKAYRVFDMAKKHSSLFMNYYVDDRSNYSVEPGVFFQSLRNVIDVVENFSN